MPSLQGEGVLPYGRDTGESYTYVIPGEHLPGALVHSQANLSCNIFQLFPFTAGARGKGLEFLPARAAPA